MNLLTKAELVAEFLVTYFFRKPAGSIQPVQVARELVKSMLNNKQISITHVYVPNKYRVYVNPKDFALLESFGEAFLIELAKYLYDEGNRLGLTFLTLPVVEILPRENVTLSSVRINIEFSKSLVADWQIETEKNDNEPEDLEKTTVLPESGALLKALAADAGRKTAAYLEIIKGNEEGRIFRLNQDGTVVGRNYDCDIVVPDVEISRRHFKLFLANSRWFVQDLGSMNGTYVNKLRVDQYLVNYGDRIIAGQTHFKFKVEK